MKTLEKLLLVMEMITQLVVYIILEETKETILDFPRCYALYNNLI